jgi:adenylate cyclase
MSQPSSDSPAAPSAASSTEHPAGAEIERKFLVTEPPGDLHEYPSEQITQGYLSLDPEGAEVRLRRRGYHTLLTIKQGLGLARAEEEFLIDGPRFERLWAGTSGRRVEKTRYRVPADGDRTIEVDVYDGALSGLIVAEVEFDAEDAASAFVPPTWLRLEVTDDPRYGNARLALDGVPDRKSVGEHALLDGEPLEAGLIHVATAQVDVAADALQGRDAEAIDKAVHTARKAFKRGRALVRVARDGLGHEVAERDNDAFREAGRKLSGARDAQVVVETLAALAKRYPDELTDERIAKLTEALEQQFAAADAAARSDAGAVAEVLEVLHGLRGDLATWSLGDEPAEVLARGFERIHKRGRTMLAATRSKQSGDELHTEEFHDLRKRAKDLWHAAELLEIAAPKRMVALATHAHDLADHVGDDHDLAVLAGHVDHHPECFDDPADAELLQAVIEKRRRKLQRKALRVADEIYDGKPTLLVERIRELGDR